MSLLSSSFLRAQHVMAVTAKSWGIAPLSAHALARRAHHGYVPVRAVRRLARSIAGSAAVAAVAHSW